MLTGTFLPYGGAAAPPGYLDCDGAAVSRSTYAALFAVLGVAYGPGDGATTFNLPDFRGRALVGAGSGAGLTPRDRGQTGGAERHTLSWQEMPRHTHTYGTVSLSTESSEGGGGPGPTFLTAASLNGDTWDTGPNGDDQPHASMPPFGVVRWVVKA